MELWNWIQQFVKGGKMNWKAFGLALLHAAIGGAAAGASTALAGGNSLKVVGSAAAGSAITSVLSLFAKAPAPAPDPAVQARLDQLSKQ